MGDHEHHWRWRRKRNASKGFWECVGCGVVLAWAEVGADGRPMSEPCPTCEGTGEEVDGVACHVCSGTGRTG